MKYRVTHLLQQVPTISVEAKPCLCQANFAPCPPRVLIPLCMLLSFFLLRGPKCRVWIHHAYECNRCEVASPRADAMQARHRIVCLQRLLSKRRELVAFCQKCWQFTNILCANTEVIYRPKSSSPLHFDIQNI